jgi:mono/diheme cytochrome c family protein
MSPVFWEKKKDHFATKMRFCMYFCGAIVIAVTVNSPDAFAASNDEGKSVFHENCSTCHGEDGTADTPVGKQLGAKNLQSAEVQKLSNQKIASIIKNGSGAMPPFKDGLSDKEVRDVLAYVRILGRSNKSK